MTGTCECDECEAFYARHTKVNADGETERHTIARACRAPEATFPLIARDNSVRWERVRLGVDSCERDGVRYIGRELLGEVWNPDAAWSAGMSGAFCAIAFDEPRERHFSTFAVDMGVLHASNPDAFARWVRTWQRLRTLPTNHMTKEPA